MRYKFRGKMTTGQWVYGLLSEDRPNSTAYYDKCKYRISWFGEDGAEYNAPVLTETVGQFTGKLDKNKTEICEHDIVLMENQKHKVVYVEDYAMYMLELEKHYRIGLIEYESDELEIIGNIHEVSHV